jgi:Holliday junction resolvase-like predicted endonuclease
VIFFELRKVTISDGLNHQKTMDSVSKMQQIKTQNKSSIFMNSFKISDMDVKAKFDIVIYESKFNSYN